MRVAITGAGGLIGGSLVAALQARGDAVLAFSRHPDSLANVFAGVELFIWPPAAEFPAADAVINLAGESVAGRWTPRRKTDIRESRVSGTRLLVAAMETAPVRPRTLINASAVGYYGDRGEEPLTESAGPGRGFLCSVCREWEDAALEAESLGLRVAMVRTGMAISPDGGALKGMLPAFKAGLGGPIGSGHQWFPWIHIDDVVRLLLWLVDGDVSGPVNVTAPCPVRQGEFAQALGAALRRPALISTPHFVLRLLFGEFSDTLFQSQCVLPEKAQRCGFTFQYPELPAALENALG
jgi:uncharacterized protein (TIGR01777 family)